MVWHLWRFWQIKGHTHEARRYIDMALALPGGSSLPRAKAREASAGIAWWQGDLESCHENYRDLVDIHREMGDPAEIANALYNLGLTTAFFLRDLTTAGSILAEAEAIYADIGLVGGLADVHWALGNLGIVGDDETGESLTHIERAAEEYRQAGNVFGEGWALFEMANYRLRRAQHEMALPSLRSGLEIMWESGDESAVVMFVMLFAAAASAAGDTERAYRLAGAALALRDRSGLDIISVEENQIPGFDIRSLDALDESDRAILDGGRQLSIGEAVALALEG